jgi:hypothetical protein
MTMMLIALAGLILAGTARYSLGLAMQSLAAQEQLQRQWGSLSLRRALLEQAPKLFAPPDRENSPADGNAVKRPAMGFAIKLGHLHFELVLADEDAKLNLNSIYVLGQREACTRLLSNQTGAMELPMMLRPYRTQSQDQSQPAFDSWGQVYALEQLAADQSAPRALLVATHSTTLWGSGQLNLRQASDESVAQLCGLVVDRSAVEQLLARRAASDDWQLVDLWESLSINQKQRRQLQSMTTDTSHCYSLWMRSCAESREDFELHICELDSDQPPRVSSFVW